LYVVVRRALAVGPDVTPDLLEDACGVLRHRYGLAAVPAGPSELWVAGRPDRPTKQNHGEDWEIDVTDAGGGLRRISFRDAEGKEVLPKLIERGLIASLAGLGDLWRLDSPRIWFASQPFLTCDGICAYRRYEIGALPIEGVGVGVAVDIGTSFFSSKTLADFFDPSLTPLERCRSEDLFDRLTLRQIGQKGTLLYDLGRSQRTCYFAEAPDGVTCGSTGPFRVRGVSYPSLLAYYQKTNPDLPIAASSTAVKVSFRGLDRPVWVAAERLRVRIANDNVPDQLASVDKIAPDGRERMVARLWARLGPHPFGDVAPGVRPGFWQPDLDRIVRVAPPTIQFGHQAVLKGSNSACCESYAISYRERAELLERAGCYHVPATLPNVIHLAIPQGLDDAILARFSEDVQSDLGLLVGQEIGVETVPYDTVEALVTQLRGRLPGGVLAVLNHEPAAYHEVAFGLQEWRVKRIIEQTLCDGYLAWRDGVWDRRRGRPNLSKGRGIWRGFIRLVSLDLLQQLDVIPFRLAGPGLYDAQLAIDVGHDRTHVSMSLLISRDEQSRPAFRIATKTQRKGDPQHETINPRLLQDDLVRLVRETLGSKPSPIASLLVTRDGLLGRGEAAAIHQAVVRLQQEGLIATSGHIDVCELHKSSLKPIRLWERVHYRQVSNPIEGTLVLLGAKTAIMATTGAATLRQGTSDPLLVVAEGSCPSVSEPGRALIASAQLNWSSPAMSQRLPLELKRTDDDLKSHAAREVRRVD
jgi:hypothetical protein